MNDSDSSKPQRRWYQFSLRTLLVFVAVVSVVLACIAPYLRWRYDTAPIWRMGGWVGGKREVWWGAPNVNLSGQRFTDARLNEIKGPLEGLTELRKLNIYNTQITDAGLVHLKGMTQVKRLHLDDNPFTDARLIHLKGMTQLEELSLCDSQFTDTGLVHLKGMTQLKRLYLYHSQITDAGLEHLKGHTRLEYLELGLTQVTDAGLDHLAGLTRLKYLGIHWTKVTPQGASRLRQALPDCDINH